MGNYLGFMAAKARAQKNEIINLIGLNKTQERLFRAMRWRARTDLGWLCREILDFKHVTDNSSFPNILVEDGPDEPIHQPLIDILQKFPSPSIQEIDAHDRLVNGRWEYKPLIPLLKLQGKRRVLILDSRGFLKTSINVIAHTIQWIINYPDIAIMIVQSNSDKAIDFVQKIKTHFQGNEKFRKLFPEHCPVDKPLEWGRQDRFTSEARSPFCTRSEPTVMAGSIEKGGSGIHVDIIKFSDIVEPSNITGNGIELVKKNFYMMQNLLVSPIYWVDVEGTRYAFGDLYGEILDNEIEVLKRGQNSLWNIYTRAVFKKTRPDGKPQQFTPEELDYPCLLDSEGKRISWWPKRFPRTLLEDAEHRDASTFATQQMNNPALAMGNIRPFPVTEWESREISPENYARVPVSYKEISVDFAHTITQRSDFTAITLASFTTTGRCYVEKIIHGRMLPDQALEYIVALIQEDLIRGKHLRALKIEKTAFTHGFMPSIRRKFDLLGIWLNIILIPRDSDKSKEERIMQTLQPWYKAKDIRFLSNIAPEAKKALKKELNEFPSGAHDDILDSISDLFQDKEWFGRMQPELNTPEERQHFFQQKTQRAMSKAMEKMVLGELYVADDPIDSYRKGWFDRFGVL